MAEETTVIVGGEFQQPTPGSSGEQTQLPGGTTSVSTVAGATGGIGAGNLVQPDIDKDLYEFKSNDTPMMQLMLRAKKVNVTSPEVDHYIIDEPKASVTTEKAVAASDDTDFVLPLISTDKSAPRACTTLLVKGVWGYDATGQNVTYGTELMLYVIGRADGGQPKVIAVNGPKKAASDVDCTTPAIPAGNTCILMGNALSETQRYVDPDTIVPQPTTVYLQKRAMNEIVSDYFDKQKKRIPFNKALIAEAQITNFKVKGNRTLLAGVQAKKVVETELGPETVYFSGGVLRQVKKEIQWNGRPTYEKFIALAKLLRTGEDVPNEVVGLCDKDFLENLQKIDFSGHPEIKIEMKTNEIGWNIHRFTTAFGPLDFRYEPTLDRLEYNNCCLMIAYDRLVHYVYSQEHTEKNRVEGREADRKSTIVWDGLGLKGTCHVWINGTNNTDESTGVHLHYWDSESAPANPGENCLYYLLSDCPGIDTTAIAGTIWKYADSKWSVIKDFITAVTED